MCLHELSITKEMTDSPFSYIIVLFFKYIGREGERDRERCILPDIYTNGFHLFRY